MFIECNGNKTGHKSKYHPQVYTKSIMKNIHLHYQSNAFHFYVTDSIVKAIEHHVKCHIGNISFNAMPDIFFCFFNLTLIVRLGHV